jgi:hypothetical protein
LFALILFLATLTLIVLAHETVLLWMPMKTRRERRRSNLVNAVTAANLAANHAVLFKPNGGNLAGHIFLVVDANGTGGYQSSADFDGDPGWHRTEFAVDV